MQSPQKLKKEIEYEKEIERLELIKLISKEIKSYGILEKYFYTVINPKKYGPINYWKLINYYWQAYFSVIIPMCEYSTENGTKFFIDLNIEFDKNLKMFKNKNNYLIFLNNLHKITK